MQERKKPLLPDGSEVIVAAVAALVLGLILVWADFDAVYYITAVLVTFVGGAFGMSFWSVEDRMYWRAKTQQIQFDSILDALEQQKGSIRDTSVRHNLIDGVGNARLIIEALAKMKPNDFSAGMNDLSFDLKRVEPVVPEFINLQNHPSIGGQNHDQLMQDGANAIDGFAQEMVRKLDSANSGKVSEFTTNAKMLAAMRNLLGKDPTKKAS